MKRNRKNISKPLASLIISSFALSGCVITSVAIEKQKESIKTLNKLKEL